MDSRNRRLGEQVCMYVRAVVLSNMCVLCEFGIFE